MHDRESMVGRQPPPTPTPHKVLKTSDGWAVVRGRDYIGSTTHEKLARLAAKALDSCPAPRPTQTLREAAEKLIAERAVRGLRQGRTAAQVALLDEVVTDINSIRALRSEGVVLHGTLRVSVEVKHLFRAKIDGGYRVWCFLRWSS